MVLNETIQIPHYAVGWVESCSAKLGVQCSYGGTILETFTFEKIIPSVQLLSLPSFDRLSLTPPVAQPPNHHRGLLLKLNTAVSFVHFPNLDPKPEHHDLSRVRLSRQAPSLPRRNRRRRSPLQNSVEFQRNCDGSVLAKN
ncbi:hypothetical protein EV1_023148 [Malus domestica]